MCELRCGKTKITANKPERYLQIIVKGNASIQTHPTSRISVLALRMRIIAMLHAYPRRKGQATEHNRAQRAPKATGKLDRHPGGVLVGAVTHLYFKTQICVSKNKFTF